MLKTSNHSGVEGYVIKNIKNQIDFALQVRWHFGTHVHGGCERCWLTGFNAVTKSKTAMSVQSDGCN